MKSANTILLAITIILLGANANAQWVRTSGPFGGWINTLYVNGTNLYAGLGSVPYGIFRSTDNGVTWENRGNLLADARSFTSLGSDLYVAAYDWGVHRTTNDGASWTFTSIGITNNKVLSLSALGTTLFVATQDSGVFSSTNNGANWVRTTLPKGYYSHLAVSGSNIIAARKTVSGDTLYVSTDNGSNWTRTATATVFRTLTTIGTNVFAGTFFGPLRSTDNGITWSLMNSGLNAQTWSFASIGTDIYATTGSALYKSTNNGTSWTNNGTTPDIYNSGASLASLGTALFYATPQPFSGIYRSTDAGVSWTWLGLPILSLTALGSNGTTLFTGYTHTLGGAVHRSTDVGATWPVTQGISSFVSAIESHGGNVYTGTNVGIFKSTTDGSSWQFNLSVSAISKFHSSGSTLYAVGTSAGVRVTTDNGTTWSVRGLQNRNPKAITTIGPFLLVGGQNSIYISTDAGLTWMDTVDFAGVNEFATLGSRVYAGRSNGVFYSSDNGVTWQNAGTFLNTTCLVASANRLFAGSNLGVFANDGVSANWIQMNSGLSPVAINKLHINSTNLYAAGQIVWKRPLSELTGVSEIPGPSPPKFQLSQNYPNPFNPATRIRFSIPPGSSNIGVSLRIYDIVGREVAVLVNEEMEGGTYEAVFDAAKLASGTYLYKLHTGSFVKTKKMLLMK